MDMFMQRKKYANRFYVLSGKKEFIDIFQDIDYLEKYYDITFYSEKERYRKYICILQS